MTTADLGCCQSLLFENTNYNSCYHSDGKLDNFCGELAHCGMHRIISLSFVWLIAQNGQKYFARRILQQGMT